MKKLIASTGMTALSVVGLNAAYTPGLSQMEASKPWGVSLAVRGFYDDNPLTSPSATKSGSSGFEIAPTLSLKLPLEQTYIQLDYAYSLRYYVDRPGDSNNDQSHQFGAKLEHAFNERNKISVFETFILAQEPTVVDPNGIVTVPLRTDGNNLHNTAGFNYSHQFSERISAELGYVNGLYNYDQDATDVPGGVGSRSALLDRVENLISLDLRYQMQPDLIVLTGYQFALADYTANELIFGPPTPVYSDSRNTRSQYFYVGADKNFNQELNGSLRVGGRYTDYVNSTGDNNKVSPYVDGSLGYNYNPGSALRVGVRMDMNPTDVVGTNPADPTLDQMSLAMYASMTHKITSRVSANLLGQYQLSQFNGGSVDGMNDSFFVFGASLTYLISPHLTAESGYNFDRLDSDIPNRSYSRNRVFIGIKGTY